MLSTDGDYNPSEKDASFSSSSSSESISKIKAKRYK
jgi:hypothetical protein